MALKVADLLVVISGDAKGFLAATQRVSANLDKVGRKMQTTGRTFSVGLSLPLAALGGIAAKTAMEFDDAMTQIVSLVGIGRDQVEGWKEDILKIGPATGRMSGELARAMFAITSAGQTGAEALKILENSAKAAAIGLGDTRSVAFAVVSAVNAYGSSILDAEQATAELMMTVRKGNLEASSLAPTLGRVLPVASELGVQFHEVGAAMAAMTRLGNNADEAATQLAATMNAILKPSQGAKEAALAYGISLRDMRRTLREEGLLALLQQLREVTADNAEGMSVVFENVRALRGVLALVGNSASATEQIFKEMAGTTKDDLAGAFKDAGESARVQMEKALSTIDTALVRLGEEVLPRVLRPLATFADNIATLGEAFANLSPFMHDVVIGFGGIVIAIGPVLWILGTLARSVTALMGLFGGLTGATYAQSTANADLTLTTGIATETLLGYSYAATSATTSTTVLTGATTTLAGAADTAKVAVVGMSVAMKATLLGVIVSLIPLAYKLGKTIANMYGEIKTPAEEFTASLIKHQSTFQTTLDQYNLLRKRLGKVGEEWVVQADWTEENAKRLARLMEEVQKLAKEKREARQEEADAQREAGLAAQREKDEILEQAEAIRQTKDLIKEKYGLITSGDVIRNLKVMTEQYKFMKDQQYDLKDGAGKFGDEIVKAVQQLAKAKVPLSELPEPVRKMIDELAPSLGAEFRKVYDQLLMFGPQYEQMIPNMIFSVTKAATDASTKIGDTLAGGWGLGTDEGITIGQKKVQEFQKWMDENPIKVRWRHDERDFAELMTIMEEIANGERVPGGGRVPS